MKTIASVVMLVALTGCASLAPVQPHDPPKQEFTFNAPFDTVWTAIVERATDKSWDIQTIDKSSGFLGTNAKNIVSGFGTESSMNTLAYPPFGSNLFNPVIWDGARQKIAIFVKRLGDSSTSVKINISYEVFESNAHHSWYAWASNGANEKVIAEYIQSKGTSVAVPEKK